MILKRCFFSFVIIVFTMVLLIVSKRQERLGLYIDNYYQDSLEVAIFVNGHLAFEGRIDISPTSNHFSYELPVTPQFGSVLNLTVSLPKLQIAESLLISSDTSDYIFVQIPSGIGIIKEEALINIKPDSPQEEYIPYPSGYMNEFVEERINIQALTKREARRRSILDL